MTDGPSGDAAGLSVVVPCYDADRDLDLCLAALRADGGPGLEIVVVDDASPRGDPNGVATRHGARCIRLDANAGPGIARNVGVANAGGATILFVDADVCVQRGTLERVREALAADPRIGACFGSYDEAPSDPRFLSQFRNLYHRWVHQHANPEATTFWTGCGAVRRDAFVAVGGFSRALSRLGMEDIELGYRLRDAGWRIRLVKNLTGTHLKAWTLAKMVRTDIFHRGVPWLLLLLARRGSSVRERRDLNLDTASRLATVAGAVLPAGLIAGMFWPPALLLALTAGAAIVVLRWGFLRYVRRLRGIGFAALSVPALWLLFACAAAAVPLALARAAAGQGLKGRLARPGDRPAT